jgi:two-component system OmpR family sensor kinase
VFKSLRSRLTVWHLLFFTLLQIGFSLFIYALLSKNLYQQLDLSLLSTAKSAGSVFRTEVLDRGGLEIGTDRALLELRLSNTLLAIFDGTKLLGASDPRFGRLPALSDLIGSSGDPPHSIFGNIRDLDTGESRVVVFPVDIGQKHCFVAAMASKAPIAAQLTVFRRIIFVAVPIFLIAEALGGFLVAGRSLAPLTAISRQAEKISATNLGTRLDIGEVRDDLGRLAGVINSLLSRLERSFDAMRGFVADASHEFRTPLAIIRAEADVSLLQDRTPAEYKVSLATIQDEARRLSSLVNNLLDLARSDGGNEVLNKENFYLNDALEECYRSAQTVASGRGIELSISCVSDVAFVGDQILIRRSITNLLENAIRYTPSGGRVSASIEVENGAARLKVCDTGIGIPPEYTQRVFDRFFRVDPSRSAGSGGYGLGLSIVKWIAEAHGGSVQVSSQLGTGSVFTISLPLPAAA